MPFQTLNKDEFDNMRTQVLAADFRKINNVLAGKKTTVAFKPAGDTTPAAWSDKTGSITINQSVLGSLASADTLVRVFGLNYHELSHVMYTDDEPYWVLEAVQRSFGNEGFVQWAWNLLEDQRIEYLFIGKYGATRPYFVSIIGRYIINKDESDWDNLFPLVAHRPYLDSKVVAGLRERYVKSHDEETADTIEGLIGEYVDLGPIDRKNRDDAVTILEEFCKALMESSPQEQMPESPHHDPEQGEGSDGVEVPSSGGKGKGKGKGKKGKSDKSDASEDEGEDESEGGSGGDDEADDDEDGESGSGSGSGDSKGKGSADDTDEDSEDESDGSGNSAGKAGGKKAGKADGKSITADELLRQMQEQVNDAEGSQEVRSAVNERQRSINGRQSLSKESFGTPQRSVKKQVDPMDKLISKRVATELQRLALDQDPGFVPLQNSGRINMQRAIQPEHDPQTVFDQWYEGQQDAADIEVVILVDTSGSMSGNPADRASRAVWILRDAVQLSSTTSQVTTFGFGSTTSLVSARGERPDPNQRAYYGATGGTEINPAMEAARMIFATSTKSKAVLFVISDGDFGDEPEAKKQNELMNAAGITTAIVYLDSSDGTYGAWAQGYSKDATGMPKHIAKLGFHVMTAVTDMGHLVQFGKDTIKQVIASPSR